MIEQERVKAQEKINAVKKEAVDLLVKLKDKMSSSAYKLEC